MPAPAPSPRPWTLARTFVGIYGSFGVLLLAIAAVDFYTQYEAERVTLETNERVGIALARRALPADIASVTTDLMVMTRQMEHLAATAASEDLKHRLARMFSAFITEKRLYDQARFIDAEGREVVRVNFSDGRPRTVAPAALQDKSSRYCFSDTAALPRGAIYISPLDLNVEQGAIERPLKPMLRFATPAVDPTGKRLGILVLNYLGRRMLADFRGAAPQVEDHVHLLNSRGYRLSSPDTDYEWGFMLNHERVFGGRFPQEWATIRDGSEGQFVNGRGLFTFATVSPVATAQDEGA